MNIEFLVKLGKSGSKVVEVYGDNAMKKTAVYKLVTHFSEGRESVTDERDQDGQQRAELNKILQKFITLCVKIIS
jgi:hypothetical protein